MMTMTEKDAGHPVGCDECGVDSAGERTALACERTLLANERTFSAWLRTGLAATIAGLGVANLLRSHRWPALTYAIGVFLILTGAICYSIGLYTYERGSRRLENRVVRQMPGWAPGLMVWLLVLTSILALTLLLLHVMEGYSEPG
jgi:putative membrane protein